MTESASHDRGAGGKAAPKEPSTVALAPWTGRHTHEVLAVLEREGISVTVEEDAFPGRAMLELIRPAADAKPGDQVVASVFGGRVVSLRKVPPAGGDPGGDVDRLGALEQRLEALEAKVGELAATTRGRAGTASTAGTMKKAAAKRSASRSNRSPRSTGERKDG